MAQEEERQLSNGETCSICHNSPPINAVQIECGHIFCFLCVKSTIETTGACALCRREIGIEFNFQQHSILGATRLPSPSEDGSYWFYEGFRGWWLYDADTNNELEQAYQRGDSFVEKYISGAFYTIDLLNKSQRPKDGDGRVRKVCRSTLELQNILGLSGLRAKDFSELLDMMRSASSPCIGRTY